MLKLGNLKLSVPFIQAPLSGYSDLAMRKLAMDFGAPLTFSGVMLAKSAANPKVFRNRQFRPSDDEHPVGAQILGNDSATMANAARALQNAGYDIIDLNFACPTPKVIRRQRGGYLLKEPERAIEIYGRVREAVACPVTIKLRTGFDSSLESYDNFYKIVTESSKYGVDALTIHARTVVQKFTGEVDWELLAEIKRDFPETIIIGSGDNFSALEIIERLKKSKLDGVLIARGAIGNPWIFQSLNNVWAGKPAPSPPDLTEQAEVILKHFEMLCALFGVKKAIGYFRKFLVHYCRIHPERKQVQKELIAANTKPQLLTAIEKWYGIQDLKSD